MPTWANGIPDYVLFALPCVLIVCLYSCLFCTGSLVAQPWLGFTWFVLIRIVYKQHCNRAVVLMFLFASIVLVETILTEVTTSHEDGKIKRWYLIIIVFVSSNSFFHSSFLWCNCTHVIHEGVFFCLNLIFLLLNFVPLLNSLYYVCICIVLRC